MLSNKQPFFIHSMILNIMMTPSGEISRKKNIDMILKIFRIFSHFLLSIKNEGQCQVTDRFFFSI